MKLIRKFKVVLVTAVVILLVSTPDFAADLKKADDIAFTKVEEKAPADTADLPQPAVNHYEEDFITNQKNNTSTDFTLSEVTFIGAGGRNTSINNSILLENDSSAKGVIDHLGQTKWYGFFQNSQCEASIKLHTDESLDADLFLYLLNTENMNIKIIDKSVSEGPGSIEEISGSLDKGIYYVAVSGYEGQGNFSITYTENNKIE